MTVFVASDRALFREALADALTERGVEVVGESGEAGEPTALVRRRKPDVLVLDVEGTAEAEAELEEVFEASPATRVVVIARSNAPRQGRALLEAGASAYLGKRATLGELLSAVETSRTSRRKPLVVDDRAAALTDRQLEILTLAASGFSNRRIASTLHLAEATVKRHLSNAYLSMGVNSRGEAASKALKEGWIALGDVIEGRVQDRESSP